MVENEVTQIMGSGFLSTAHYSNHHRTILTKKSYKSLLHFFQKFINIITTNMVFVNYTMAVGANWKQIFERIFYKLIKCVALILK